MTDQMTVLMRLNEELQTLTQLLDGVPDNALEEAGAIRSQSIKEICCELTAWDGESLRRLQFAIGQSFSPPHDPHDTVYWQSWIENQKQIKRVMPIRGVLVDLVSTRQRLIAAVAELNDFQFDRWEEIDPLVQNSVYLQIVPQLTTWRNHRQSPPNKSSILSKLRQLFKRNAS